MAFTKTKQQVAILELAKVREWNVLVTLTFTSLMTQEQVTRALKPFLVAVERACFGRQAKVKSIHCLPVIEHTAEATHVHLAMLKPDDCKHKQFRDIMSRKWLKIKGAGRANLRIDEDRKSWYEPIKDTDADRERVVCYISKKVASDYETVDIENIKV